MKIGLVGEAPNDTQSVKNLLQKEYDFDFFSMLDRINGSKLDSQKTKRFLRIEYETKNPNIVIFIRDLDGFSSNKDQLEKRKFYFTNSNRVVDKKGIFLLHIYEIEALILCDVATFNLVYNTELDDIDDPMLIEEPKEYLKTKTKLYNESHNSDIFEKLNFEKTLNCSYFKEFIASFNIAIDGLS